MKLSEALHRLSIFSISLASFFLPLGTAPMKFFLWTGVLLGFPLAFKKCWEISKSKVAIWALILLGWILVSATWSTASNAEIYEFISRYTRLGLVGFVAVVLASEAKTVFKSSSQKIGLGVTVPSTQRGPGESLLESFVWGCLLAGLLALITWSGVVHQLAGVAADQRVIVGPNDAAWITFGAKSEPNFAYAHIAASTFLVFAANIVLATWNHGRRKSVRLVAILFLVIPVLLMQSRTGYVLLMLSSLFWIWHVFKKFGTKFGLTVFFSVSVLTVLIFLIFPNVKPRVIEAIEDVRYFATTGQYDNRSQATRLEFWIVALKQAAQSPSTLMFGTGIGAYSTNYQSLRGRAVPEPSGQPHNEYLALLSQTGLVGLVLFLGVLWAACRVALMNNSDAHRDRRVLVILPALLGIDALFNSIIWNMEEGHLALFLLASLAAHQIRNSLPNQHRV